MSKIVHMGKEVRKRMEAEGRKSSWLAKKIACDTSKIYRIYHQQYVEVKHLIPISIFLDFNFFSYYSGYVDDQIQKKSHNKMDE